MLVCKIAIIHRSPSVVGAPEIDKENVKIEADNGGTMKVFFGLFAFFALKNVT